jgi:hypothetical protein
MGEVVKQVYKKARKADIFHVSIEIALERVEVDGKEKWGYYFADHDKRVVFWLEPHKSRDLLDNVRGVKRQSHVKYALESQYWMHIELFPNKRFLPEDVLVRLKEIVMFTQADSITSEKCLAPYASDEVSSMLGLMDPLMMSTRSMSTLCGLSLGLWEISVATSLQTSVDSRAPDLTQTSRYTTIPFPARKPSFFVS